MCKQIELCVSSKYFSIEEDHRRMTFMSEQTKNRKRFKYQTAVSYIILM